MRQRLLSSVYYTDRRRARTVHQPDHLTLRQLFHAVQARSAADMLPLPLPLPLVRTVSPEGYSFAHNLAPPRLHSDPAAVIQELEARVIALEARIDARDRGRDDVSVAEHDLHERRPRPRRPARGDRHPTGGAPPSAPRPGPPSRAAPSGGTGAAITAELRRLRESAGAPSAADLTRLTRRGGTL